MKSALILSVIVLINLSVLSQSGGNNTYDFLNLTNSARVTSLGGQQVSIYDDDINLIFHNPSILSENMDNHLVLNYINYFAGINFGYAAYAWKPNKPYNLAAGIHYIYYGEMIEATASGIKTGTFRAAEYAFNLYYSKTLIDSLLYVGVNLKPLFSDLETYTSFGIAFDAGITYSNPGKLFSVALVFKNAGLQIKKYYPDSPREPLPFEIQLGLTQQLKHAPFRFSILGQQLQDPDLSFKTDKQKEDEIDILTGEKKDVDKIARFGDNVMRHVVIGVEFIPSNNFNIRIGYNYKLRQEMKIEEKPAMVGFSWGFGIRISKFHISYGRSSYHISRGTNHFSVSVNLSELGNKL